MQIVDVVTERFGNRPVPADLSALVALSSNEDSPLNHMEAEFIDPARGHPLLDHSYLNDNDRANPDIMANVAAIDEVLGHAVFVACDGNDNLYGYWLHQDETAATPAIVRFDSEGQFAIMGGSLIEAMISSCTFDEQEFARLAQIVADAGVPITAHHVDEIAEPAVVTSPVDLHDRHYRAERAKRGLPDF